MLQRACWRLLLLMASVQQIPFLQVRMLRGKAAESSSMGPAHITRYHAPLMQLVEIQFKVRTVHVMHRSNARKHLEPDQRWINGGEETRGQRWIDGGEKTRSASGRAFFCGHR
jgi:hypothetical protein